MNKFIKLFWFFSLLGFLATLLFVYAALRPEVDVSLGSGVIPAMLISKNAFFYTMIIIIVLTNAVLLALSKFIGMLKTDNKSNRFIFGDEPFKKNLINWLGSFSVVLNLFYAMGTLFIGLYNNIEYVPTAGYSFLVYASIILIVGWLFWLVYIVLKKVKTA